MVFGFFGNVQAAENFSTCLSRSSSQFWGIADGSQTGLDLNSAVTITAWIKLDSDISSAGDFRGIVGKLVHGGSNAYGFVYSNESGNKRLQFYGEDSMGTGAASRYDVTLNTSQWYFVAVTNNSGAVHFWIDNSKVAGVGSTTSTIRNGTAPFEIGNTQLGSSNDYFNGNIKDVRVWNRVLSDSEVDNVRGYPKTASNGSNLQGWWKFENDGTDSSGNGNTLTSY